MIPYRQNGERFARQRIVHIDRDVELFERAGDASGRFERIDDRAPENPGRAGTRTQPPRQ